MSEDRRLGAEDWRRIRGLKRLIHDGVRLGSEFVEKHHRHAADRPFAVLESIEAVAAPVRIVHAVHDGVIAMSYGSIRVVNKATAGVGDWVIDQLEPADSRSANDDDG